MPNFLEYRKSISDELISLKDRVRRFIDDKHWGEDGRYKEIILSEKLREYLPENVLIGTGFVMCEHNSTTTQIDVIIYRNDIPVLFKKENFVIVTKESVLGIIEVKTTLSSRNIEEAIRKAHNNGLLIGPQIFNGIFSFDCEYDFQNLMPPLLTSSLKSYAGYINNITFGKDIFMKYWLANHPTTSYDFNHYSFYKIEDLAFGYFISNLIEDVHIQQNNVGISQTLNNMLYPIEEGKEVHKIHSIKVTLD